MFDRIEIIDVMDNVKLEKSVSKTSNYQVDVSHLLQGIYYLQLYNNNELIEKKRIEIETEQD